MPAVERDNSSGVGGEASVFRVERVCVLRHFAAERHVALVLEVIQSDGGGAQGASVRNLQQLQVRLDAEVKRRCVRTCQYASWLQHCHTHVFWLYHCSFCVTSDKQEVL